MSDQQAVAANASYGARAAALQAASGANSAFMPQNETSGTPKEIAPPTSIPRTALNPSHRKPVPISHTAEKRTRRSTSTRARRNPLTFLRSLSRRALIILTITLLALLILIIGLAVGLSRRHAQNLPLPSSHGGPYTGDLTYYAPGLGACGVTSANGDNIVAVSHIIFDAVQQGSDPNTNPLCGQMLRVQGTPGGRSVDLKVVDRCVGCAARDLDVTEDTFAELADVALGRVVVHWSWLQDVA